MIKTIITHHDDCDGENEKVDWKYKLEICFCCFVHAIVETEGKSKVKVDEGYDDL